MQADQQLSPHFRLSEFTHSQAATRFGIANEPAVAQLVNLARLAYTLEDVRVALGDTPLIISSGYRSAALNDIVGGASRPPSAHLDGRAADFIAPAFGTPRQVCQRLIDLRITFDQLIFEGGWVHFGIAAAGAQPRSQVLTAVFAAHSRPRYLRGLI